MVRHGLYSNKGYHPDKIRVSFDGRQQLAVKGAEAVEDLPLDWVRVDLQGVALQGQHEDAPDRLRVNEFTLLILLAVILIEEHGDYEKDEEGELKNPQQGRRIFVLSLQGDTLQVYTHPVEGQLFCDSLCCFDGKLLAPVRDWRSSIAKEVVALCDV